MRKETGILVESNNIDQLAGAISDLSGDYQKSRVLGEQGHALLMQEFTLGIHTQRLQRIYDQKTANSLLQFRPSRTFSIKLKNIRLNIQAKYLKRLWCDSE